MEVHWKLVLGAVVLIVVLIIAVTRMYLAKDDAPEGKETKETPEPEEAETPADKKSAFL